MASRLLFVACLVLCFASSLFAQGKNGDPQWIITAECQMIIVPQKLALGLIPELSDDEKIDAAWERVQKLIEEGEIELIATLLAKGNAEERIVSETIEEMRYPREFDPPTLPGRFRRRTRRST